MLRQRGTVFFLVLLPLQILPVGLIWLFIPMTLEDQEDLPNQEEDPVPHVPELMLQIY